MTTEGPIEAHLIARVKAMGGLSLKGTIPGTRFVDRIVILPGGRTLYVECKRPSGGRRSALQIFHINRLREWGHEAYFVKTKEEIDGILDIRET